MKKETAAFLKALNLYPKEEREKRSLDELINQVSVFQISLEEENKKAEERYTSEGIWDDSRIEILREAVNYLSAGIKYKNRAFQLSYGKSRFGPC